MRADLVGRPGGVGDRIPVHGMTALRFLGVGDDGGTAGRFRVERPVRGRPVVTEERKPRITLLAGTALAYWLTAVWLENMELVRFDPLLGDELRLSW